MASQESTPDFSYIRLKTKPTAEICYSFSAPAAQQATPTLVVFVNGLGLPQMGWAPAIAKLQELAAGSSPAILTYDRFGQGRTTDQDPNDVNTEDPSHAHDCVSAADDLHQLIQQILDDKMGIQDIPQVKLVLVGNSIGTAIIRVYAAKNPGIIAGAVFLDPTITDSDFVSIFPDPDAEGFEESKLPQGAVPEDLRIARQKAGAIFHPNVGNKEGLSRRNLEELLHRVDSPPLQGRDGLGPYVTVIGHDFETFAQQSYQRMGFSPQLVQSYVNPYWHTFNEGLTKLTSSERSKGPIQAPGAGHFVQADNPDFVARTVHEMLQLI